MLLLAAPILAVQLGFLTLQILVHKRQKDVDAHLCRDQNSSGVYTLICPSVALSIMLYFWIKKGFVGTAVIVKFCVAYWIFSSVAIASQISMISLVLYRSGRHFKRCAPVIAVSAVLMRLEKGRFSVPGFALKVVK